MPSNAFNDYLVQLLADADHLDDTRIQLPPLILGHATKADAINRAIVVMCASAWEAYIEELMRNALDALRPAAPPLGVWPAHNASIRGDLGRFNTPNVENVSALVLSVIGLADVQNSWFWAGCTNPQAIDRVRQAINLRHRIAHGVNPRPAVANFYASQLPDFFRNIGTCTDGASEIAW